MQMRQMQLHDNVPGVHSNSTAASKPLLHGNSGASTGSVNECLLVLGNLSGCFWSRVLRLGSSLLERGEDYVRWHRNHLFAPILHFPWQKLGHGLLLKQSLLLCDGEWSGPGDSGTHLSWSLVCLDGAQSLEQRSSNCSAISLQENPSHSSNLKSWNLKDETPKPRSIKYGSQDHPTSHPITEFLA